MSPEFKRTLIVLFAVAAVFYFGFIALSLTAADNKMTTDIRKPTGVRITTSETNGKIAFFMHPTAKSGSAQNARHTVIKPIKDNMKIVNGLDPTEIGEVIIELLNLEKK